MPTIDFVSHFPPFCRGTGMSGRLDWAEIERLFFASLEMAAEERPAWIELNASSRAVAAEVHSLLAAHHAMERGQPS